MRLQSFLAICQMVNSELERNVLRQLQTGSSESRVQLARQLAVAPSTMGIHVDRMLRQGLLRENAALASTSGRPPKVLQLNPEAGQFIGIDLDGRQIFAVSVDFAQRRLRDRVWDIQSKDRVEEVLLRIEEAIEDVHDRHRPLLGIGIASPGAVDVSSGTSLHYKFIRGWKDVTLAERFSKRLSVPVCVENNVRAMAIAEQAFGKAKGLESAICVGNRSGIGAGILIDGELFRGPDGLAGEIGCWPVRVSRGKVTTLEKTSSLRNLMKRMAASLRAGESTSLRLHRNQVTWESIAEAIQDEDRMVLRALKEAADNLGKAMVQMSLMLNPQQIVVCGPLAEVDNAFLRPLRESLKEHWPSVNAAMPDVCGSELGEFVGSLGAGAMIARRWAPHWMRL